MESFIKNNHCGLNPPEQGSRAGYIKTDYFLCGFHKFNFEFSFVS